MTASVESKPNVCKHCRAFVILGCGIVSWHRKGETSAASQQNAHQFGQSIKALVGQPKMITTLTIDDFLAATKARGDSLQEPISLDSEDEDEPQVAEARLLPDARAHVRGGLYVANSAAGAGLFTSVAVPAGALVGYFGGVWRTDSEYADLPAAQQRLLDQYAATVKPELDGLQPEAVVVAPPIAVGQQRPDLRRYPLAAANEPLVGQVANAAFQRVQLSVDDVIGRVLDHQMDGEFVGLAVYTCSAIGANREVLLHYGPDYRRARYGYQAGEP
eukprot:6768703-Prymnesium_polylepis.1